MSDTVSERATEAWAMAIKTLREQILQTTQDQVAKAGGPNRDYQSKAEGAKHPGLSENSINQYIKAFTAIAESKSLPIATYDIGSLLSALAQANMPAEAASTAEEAHPAPRQGIYLGTDIADGTALYARTIATLPDRQQSPLSLAVKLGDEWILPSGRPGSFFPEAIARLAARQPAVTVINAGWRPVELCSHWPKSTWRTMEDYRLDPISGINTIEEAYERAGLLADEWCCSSVWGQRYELAWVILMANAMGAAHGIGALAAWNRYQRSPLHWQRPGGEMLALDLPSTEDLLTSARPVLSPWAVAYGPAQYQASFAVDGGEVTWAVNQVGWPQPAIPQAGEIVHVKESACDRVSRLLVALGTPVTEYKVDNSSQGWALILDAHSGTGDISLWLPTPVKGRVVVWKRQSRKWHAIQMFTEQELAAGVVD